MSSKYLWMAVEADEYELPIAVADSARELGEIFGLKKDVIMTSALRGHSGKISGRKYYKVENTEGD